MLRKNKVLNIIAGILFLILCGMLLCIVKCNRSADPVQTEGPADVPADGSWLLSYDGYTLDQVVILSRHNIRAPLSGGDSLLAKITPHEWFKWSSDPSELSVRGGILETIMGQYFRKWLEAEGLFPENYHPDPDSVKVYANSKQRTIATAQFFTAGLLPTAGEEIEYGVEFDTMDPVFEPKLTFVSDSYVQAAKAQIEEMFSEEIDGLADNYGLLTDVIDLHESRAWADGSVSDFSTDDTQIILELDQEPGMTGSLKTAFSASDALILQYYEEEDETAAAFGHDLDRDEWKKISRIRDVYGDVLFTAPLVACNVANPWLKAIQSEFVTNGRKFTFLCGHDSNIGSVLAALDVEEYDLPDSIEGKTPIGGKLVFSKWMGPDKKEYISADLVYQTTDEIRGLIILDEYNRPGVCHLRFKDMKTNDAGLYPVEEFEKRIQKALGDYDAIIRDYE